MTATDPRHRFFDRLDQLERRLRQLERQSPIAHEFRGPRTDGAPEVVNGVGPRVRIGLLTDGSYGVERWTSAGVRQTPSWA